MLMFSYILLFIAAVVCIFLICTASKAFHDLEQLKRRLKQEAEQRKIDADIEYDSWGK